MEVPLRGMGGGGGGTFNSLPTKVSMCLVSGLSNIQ